MEILASSVLLFLLPVIGIFIFIRGGWEAGLKFFAVIVFPVFLIFGVAAYLIFSLSNRSLEVLGISIVFLSLGFLIFRACIFYFNRQSAGKLILGKGKPVAFMHIVLGAGYFFIGLLEFSSGLSRSTNSLSVVYGASLILLPTLVVVRNMDGFEIRENGILSGARFFSWSEIESISWDHLLRKENLVIKMKKSGALCKVKAPWDQQLAITDFIKQKYPS